MPDEVQAEVFRALVEIRVEDLGVYHLDADELVALARSAQVVHLGHFAPPEAVEKTFARYRPTS